MDKDHKDAVLSIRPRIENLTGHEMPGYILKAQLYDESDKPVLNQSLEEKVDDIINEIHTRLDRVKIGLLETTVTNPNKWSFE